MPSESPRPIRMTTVDWAVFCDLAYFNRFDRLGMFGLETSGHVRTLPAGRATASPLPSILRCSSCQPLLSRPARRHLRRAGRPVDGEARRGYPDVRRDFPRHRELHEQGHDRYSSLVGVQHPRDGQGLTGGSGTGKPARRDAERPGYRRPWRESRTPSWICRPLRRETIY